MFSTLKHNFYKLKIRRIEEKTLVDILLRKYSHTFTYEVFISFTLLITLVELVPEFESWC
jgi:hypothetical protein